MATDVYAGAFSDLDHVEQRLRLVKQERDQYAHLFRQHLEVLKDHDRRGILMKNAMYDLLHAWRPAEVVRAALEPAQGVLPVVVQLAGMRGSLKRRLLWTAASLVAPALLKRMDMSKVLGTVMALFRPHEHGNGEARS